MISGACGIYWHDSLLRIGHDRTERSAMSSRNDGSGRKKRVTLTDIARRAGVSPAAVSFTLAERLDIPLAEATRKWIKQCAQELGYVPNRLSEGFFHGRSAF